MYRKCYAITNAFKYQNHMPFSASQPCWRVFAQFSEGNYLMCRTENGATQYAPLFIHSFRLVSPRKLVEAQIFNRQFRCYEEIDNIPDRLRWCRHHMGMMQKEVADLVGISRARYIDMETGAVNYFPKEIVDKLAALYHIPSDDLLDGYNRFLYQGQCQLIQQYQKDLGMMRKPFARHLGVDPNLLRAWEYGKKQVSKLSWERYFKDTIKI